MKARPAPADGSAGKDHLVVRLGRKRAVIGYILLMGFTYLSILLAAIFGITSPFTLVALVTLSTLEGHQRGPRALR